MGRLEFASVLIVLFIVAALLLGFGATGEENAIGDHLQTFNACAADFLSAECAQNR